jgi:hypothetical protein
MPVSGTTTYYSFPKPEFDSTDWHIPYWTAMDMIDSTINGVDVDLAAVELELQNALTSSVYTDESPFDEIHDRMDEMEAELKAARGGFTASTDRLETFLAAGHIMGSGANKPASFTALEYDTALMVNPVQVDGVSFTVDGDLRTTLKNGMAIRMTFATSGIQYAHIKDASYAGGPDETTVTIYDDDPEFPGTPEVVNEVAYSFVKPNDSADYTPGADIRDQDSVSFEVYYYTAATYDLPFDETAGRVSKSNTGRVARIDYSSGWQIGITYEAAGNAAKIDTTDGVEIKINGTLYERFKPTYNGDLLTDFDRAFV